MVVFGVGGLLSAACSQVLDLDDYEFRPAEQVQTPPLPLGPGADAGTLPNAPLVPAPDAGPSPVGPGDVTPPSDAGAPVGTPDPAPPRPVVIGEPDPTLALQGSLTGGEARLALCPGGVLVGLAYQWYTSTAPQPDRLSFAWPLCISLDPGTPLLIEGVSILESWTPMNLADPVFAALRDGEQFNAIGCPPNHYVVGIDGSYDALEGTVLFRSLGLQCAPLATDPERSDVVHGPIVSVLAPPIAPVLGATGFTQPCPPGTAAAQLDLRFGLWLDAVGLRCAPVRWPFTAGHVCESGPECQSGTCEAARCAP